MRKVTGLKEVVMLHGNHQIRAVGVGTKSTSPQANPHLQVGCAAGKTLTQNAYFTPCYIACQQTARIFPANQTDIWSMV